MSTEFYYDTGEEKIGPISASELLLLHQQGTITADTWVRRGDSSTWRRYADTDLRRERQIEKRKSFWRLLWQQMTPGTIFGAICLICFIGGVLTLGVFALKFLWPVLLFLLVFWWMNKAIK